MTLQQRALAFAISELREYAFASPSDFAASLVEFALAELTSEREACAEILDKEANYNSGENEQGYVDSDAEDSCRRLAASIRKRGQQ